MESEDAVSQTPEPGLGAPAPAVAAATDFRSLPAVALAFLLLGNARSLVLPLVAFLAWPRGLVFWFFLMLLPAVASSLAHFFTFRYRLEDDQMVVRQGLLNRQVRTIPFDRIQNIDLVQGPLQRLAKVSEVRLETASGGKPEAVMRVLREEEIARLREVIARHRESAEPRAAVNAPRAAEEETAAPPLVQQSTGDLVALGLLSGRAGLVLAAGLGFLHQVGFFEDADRFAFLTERLPGFVGELDLSTWINRGPLALLVAGLLALVALVVLARLLSVLWILITLHGFRLEDREDDLATRYGLFTHITATLPKRRIQLLSTHRPFLGRPWGLVSTRVETAGGSASDDSGPGAARLWLAPLLREIELPPVLSRTLPSLDLEQVRWRPLSPAAPARLARLRALVASVAALPVVVLAWPWGLLALLAPPLAAWHGWRWAQLSAWGWIDPPEGGGQRAVLFRSGALGVRESLVPLPKIQCVSVRSSPFDRRWGMASVEVDTAGSSGEHRVDIPYLERRDAEKLAASLSRQAASTTFHW
ncbi:MAG: PH domain-containing protein [Acidobacteriota bacterium]